MKFNGFVVKQILGSCLKPKNVNAYPVYADFSALILCSPPIYRPKMVLTLIHRIAKFILDNKTPSDRTRRATRKLESNLLLLILENPYFKQLFFSVNPATENGDDYFTSVERLCNAIEANSIKIQVDLVTIKNVLNAWLEKISRESIPESNLIITKLIRMIQDILARQGIDDETKESLTQRQTSLKEAVERLENLKKTESQLGITNYYWLHDLKEYLPFLKNRLDAEQNVIDEPHSTVMAEKHYITLNYHTNTGREPSNPRPKQTGSNSRAAETAHISVLCALSVLNDRRSPATVYSSLAP